MEHRQIVLHDFGHSFVLTLSMVVLPYDAVLHDMAWRSSRNRKLSKYGIETRIMSTNGAFIRGMETADTCYRD